MHREVAVHYPVAWFRWLEGNVHCHATAHELSHDQRLTVGTNPPEATIASAASFHAKVESMQMHRMLEWSAVDPAPVQRVTNRSAESLRMWPAQAIDGEL